MNSSVLPVRREPIFAANSVGDLASAADSMREYDILAAQIYKKLDENAWTTFGVSSPRAGEGKSTLVYHLAKSMARERKHTVMVVDVNFYNPSMQQLFAVKAASTIKQALEQAVDLAEVIIAPGVERLRLIAGAHLGQYGADLISSHRFAEFVQEIKQRYADRICLFDMSSFLDSNAALSMLPHLDTLLLAVRDGKTQRRDLEQVSRMLGDKKILGVVLTDAMK